MALQLGLVGLPNVGKSTLFNALTRAGAAAANYPFTTIDPNIGVAPVADPRLDRVAAIIQPDKIVPTTLRVVDIAGLVKGASQGEGLGNQFLANIRTIDAVAMVVRCFTDENVPHVTATLDPIGDIEVILTELALADLAITQGVASVRDLDQIIVLADSSATVRQWIEQVQSQSKVVTQALVTSRVEPLLTPYQQAGQLSNLVAGATGAIEYQRAVDAQVSTSNQADSYAALFLLLVVVAVVTNIVYVSRRETTQ